MSIRVKKPGRLKEALDLLSKEPNAGVIAGGTDLMPRLKRGLESREMLICIEDIADLRMISTDKDEKIALGAALRLSELLENDHLSAYTALVQSASKVATPQIRCQGTLGGNLLQETRCMYYNQSISWRRDMDPCYKLGGDRCFQYKNSPECVALFQSDVAPALISLGASATIAGPDGERQIPLESLYLKAGKKDMDRSEMLTSIDLPKLSQTNRSAYAREAIRGSFDFPVISCALALNVQTGVIATACMVLGSAASIPQRVSQAEDILIGQGVGAIERHMDEIKRLGTKKIMPFQDIRIDTRARRAMGAEMIEKVLRQVGNPD